MAVNELSRPSDPFSEREKTLELGNLLASIGNHEGKALLLASMVPGNIYFSSDLDRLMRQKQGEKPVWKISSKTPFNICATTFAPANLARVGLSDHTLRTIGYEKTEYAEEIGISFAGHMLKFSEDHPDISLIDLFGSTHTRAKKFPQGLEDNDGATIERTPLLHFRIFRELLSRQHPIRLKDLTDVVGRADFMEHHLLRLSQHGILNYEWFKKGQSVVHYTVNKDALPKIPIDLSKTPIANEIYQMIISDPSIVLSVDSVYEKLTKKYPDMPSEEQSRRRITYVFDTFADKGYISKGKFGGDYSSEISLSESQRALLSELMGLLGRFSSKDPEFIREGLSKANQIVNDPRRFNALLSKAREASANANHADPNETKKQIISILYQLPNAGNSDLQELLRKDGKDLSRGRVAQLTKELTSEGKIRASTARGTIHFAVNEAAFI